MEQNELTEKLVVRLSKSEVASLKEILDNYAKSLQRKFGGVRISMAGYVRGLILKDVEAFVPPEGALVSQWMAEQQATRSRFVEYLKANNRTCHCVETHMCTVLGVEELPSATIGGFLDGLFLPPEMHAALVITLDRLEGRSDV